jgi:hypothetical protein
MSGYGEDVAAVSLNTDWPGAHGGVSGCQCGVKPVSEVAERNRVRPVGHFEVLRRTVMLWYLAVSAGKCHCKIVLRNARVADI